MAQESGRRPKFEGPEAGTEADEHRSFNTIVGEAIRRARQEHGWTQSQLAEKSGLSPNYIARLERGELGPSLFVANRICEALGIELPSLVEPSATGGPASSAKASRATTKRRAVG